MRIIQPRLILVSQNTGLEFHPEKIIPTSISSHLRSMVKAHTFNKVSKKLEAVSERRWRKILYLTAALQEEMDINIVGHHDKW